MAWERSMNLRLPLYAVAIATLLQAQQPARPEFEVASLKPNASGNSGFAIRAMPAGLNATNISLKRLIAMAYSVTDYQIFGALPWLESQRFDLEAKAAALTALPQLRLMTQSLLDERFKLHFHHEARDLPIYSLTLVKSGLKGPGLVDAPNEPCPTPTAETARCGTVSPGNGRILGQRGRISQLADRLSSILGRTVVDQSGLTGNYDIDLRFAPDPGLQQSPGGPPADPNGPSIFTAMQEQLGLKLQAGKGPVEVIVVDSAEKPEGN
jgi:uncharacterized protein (TIGR03435 family)